MKEAKRTLKWAVFVSGRGSNLAALLDLQTAGALNISVVVSSSPDASAVFRARRAGIPVEIVGRPIDWLALSRRLEAYGVNRIFLAGFMRIVPGDFVRAWQGRILNLHPSLLPDYKGLKSIERAYADGADIGASVHIVTEGVDEGNVVRQRRCLKEPRSRGYSLRQSEFLVHIDEQRLIREAILKWNPQI